jgi:hypothetical protein
VKEFIQLHEKMFKIMNEGELADKHGLLEIPSEKMNPIMQRLAELSKELDLV